MRQDEPTMNDQGLYGPVRSSRRRLSGWQRLSCLCRTASRRNFACGDSGPPALHCGGGAAECVRSLIPGALSILKGAVP